VYRPYFLLIAYFPPLSQSSSSFRAASTQTQRQIWKIFMSDSDIELPIMPPEGRYPSLTLT
jgi:hypothetical protein